MRNKAELSGISMDHIIKREKAMFTRTFVFLYLFVFTYTCTSAESQGCMDSTVTRVSFGDRIVFYNYAGTCNKGINPCKQVNSVWRSSVRNNCTCQCLRANSAYREDIKSCVKNDQSRDGKYNDHNYNIIGLVIYITEFIRTWFKKISAFFPQLRQ